MSDSLNTSCAADNALGRKVIGIAAAVLYTCPVMWLAAITPWYVGIVVLVLGYFGAKLVGRTINKHTSDESFERVGHAIGSGLGAVRNLFSRKVAA